MAASGMERQGMTMSMAAWHPSVPPRRTVRRRDLSVSLDSTSDLREAREMRKARAQKELTERRKTAQRASLLAMKMQILRKSSNRSQ